MWTLGRASAEVGAGGIDPYRLALGPVIFAALATTTLSRPTAATPCLLLLWLAASALTCCRTGSGTPWLVHSVPGPLAATRTTAATPVAILATLTS